MTRTDSLQEYVADQLDALDGVRFRRMFGGYGIYRGERFFGILHRGRLYFRAGEDDRGKYVAQGMKPFRPSARQTLTSYYEVPADVIEDSETLVAWAERALAAASAPGKKTRRRAAGRIAAASPAGRRRRT